MKIYLITHAHTEQVQGAASDVWSLSPRGHGQAAELANAPWWNEVKRIIVSSEAKTLLTVLGVVGRRQLPVWVDSRFDELRRSGWTEDYATQVAVVFAQPDQSINGWESAESVRHRAIAGLKDLQRRFAGETLALVGHGLCLSILLAAMLGQSRVDFEAWQRLSFGSYAVLQVNPLLLLSDFGRSSQPVR